MSNTHPPIGSGTGRPDFNPQTPALKGFLGPIPRPPITLRQWYAGLALQGLLAQDEVLDHDAPLHAKTAVIYADALIAAMEAKQ